MPVRYASTPCSGEAVLGTVILAETGLAAGSCVLLFRWDASFLLPNTFGLKTGYAILGSAGHPPVAPRIHVSGCGN